MLGFVVSTITDEMTKRLNLWLDETDLWIESIQFTVQTTVTDLLVTAISTADQVGESWFESFEHSILADLEVYHRYSVYHESLTFDPVLDQNDPVYPPLLGILGDASCLNNALSPHLRCAINPSGPCEGCPDYELRPEIETKC